MAFLPPNFFVVVMSCFLEVLIVAPPFLDMCLDIFGACFNQNKSFDWDIILENIALFANTVFLNTKSWSWIMLVVVMNVLCFVLMVGWNQHMASIKMYIYTAEPINSSFRGNPYLITRLYSLKYKVTCVVHVSRVWNAIFINVVWENPSQNLHLYG